MSTLRHAGAALLLAALLGGLAACSENPQRMVSEGKGSYNLDGSSPLQERTLKQGESGRIAY